MEAPSVATLRRMSNQRRRDTEPEMLVHRALHANGLRYRVGVPVPGRPRRTIDVAFPRIRMAVFVDGCFWHGCPAHRTWPKTNADWWLQKIDANRRRDNETDQLLSDRGWRVIRIWEHDIEGGVRAVLAEVGNLQRGAA